MVASPGADDRASPHLRHLRRHGRDRGEGRARGAACSSPTCRCSCACTRGCGSRRRCAASSTAPSRCSALVVFTVVSTAHREILRRLCDEENVDAVDLIGTLMAKLSSYLGSQPKGVPGLLHTIGDEYFRRIEAVEFTVRNDDGREPRNLPKADLVLVGIRRTSKTPLSTFLAQKGLKVANVPLVLGIEPPHELFEIDQEKHLRAHHQGRVAAADSPGAPEAPGHAAPIRQLRHARSHRAGDRVRAVGVPPASVVAGHRHHRQGRRRDGGRHPAHQERSRQPARHG